MEEYNNSRCCKIVATYFGVRRFYPQNEDHTIEMLKDFVEHEKTLDPGVPNLDVIFINHNCGSIKGNKFLDSLDGEEIYSGKIHVFHRPWDNGKGVSLGSFDYGFKLLKNHYDYWFFQEDDYKVVHPEYYLNGVNMLEENINTAFIGYDMYFRKDNGKKLTPFLNLLKIIFTFPLLIFGYWKYIIPFLTTIKKTKLLVKKGKIPFCGGMMGITKTNFLNEIIQKDGNLPYPPIEVAKDQTKYKEFNNIEKIRYNLKHTLFCVLGEIEFTRIYNDLGYNLKSYPNTKELIFSYKNNKFKK